jgi:hypothetical protein
LRPRVSIPVPGPAKIAALFDHPDILNTGVPKSRSGLQSAKSAPDNNDVHVIVQRFSLNFLVWIRIVQKVGKITNHLNVLVVAIGTKTLVPFLSISIPERHRVVI